MAEDGREEITEDEAALYDRQIRLWGVEAQQRMRNASILLVGFRSLNTEVGKNIALAGVGKLTVLDPERVTDRDLGAQFFLRQEDVGKNRAAAAAPRLQTMNPRVEIVVDQEPIGSKADTFFTQFDLRIDNVCRLNNIPLYISAVHGIFGYIFCDIVNHTYIEERKVPQGNNMDPLVEITKLNTTFPSLSSSLARKWQDVTARTLKKRIGKVFFVTLLLWQFQSDHSRNPRPEDAETLAAMWAGMVEEKGIKEPSILDTHMIDIFIRMHDTELSPISAIVGGILAQDILKVLSGKELPIKNWFLYDGRDGSGLLHYISEGEALG
ncbi:hypothetical protein BZG36_00247 [Bifiguratus adelaidae]|uniref:Ubiquitin-like 1-activating enzyme E1A n=1 Tax=Bifiguratus adelaidae TaxID=1938954 RepID=A0A261Y8Q0_9FUNG|nr:hypothetical protein BZG36_00247 [Bifiguratus adelaidae]